jgi:uncharacterized membrane protein
MIPIIRLVTVHPVLVHFTIGILPVIVFAYAAAVWFKSERWSFAGDVALVICAAITLLTGSFGLISNFYLRWPGGLHFWRYLHLGFGVGSLILILGFAVVRMDMRRRGNSLTGIGAFAFSILISLVVGTTGWIGGEILVYTSGMAVAAAGDGALAPMDKGGEIAPANFPEAMGRTRALWASITTQVAYMVVHRPSERGFDTIADDAQRLGSVSHWIATVVPQHMPNANLPAPHIDAPAGPTPPLTRGQLMAKFGAELEAQAQKMTRSAHDRNLTELSNEVGATTEVCADCHEQLRWRGGL